MKVLVFLIGAVAFFGFIGVIYPTPWHKKLKIDKRWKALIVWLGASAIAGPLMPQDHTTNATTATPAATQTVQTAQTTQAAPATKPAPKPAPAPAPAPKKQWTKVIEISGDQTNSPSDRFQLTGGDVKMEWEIKPENSYAKGMEVMSGFLNDENNNTVDQFMGNPGEDKGEWKVYGVQPGTYYFKPNTANGKWHAVIYEMK